MSLDTVETTENMADLPVLSLPYQATTTTTQSKAESPPHTDGSIVFARLLQLAPPTPI